MDEIIVGNIGTVYAGPDSLEAHCVFLHYREQSQSMTGRAAGEPVTWIRNGEIYRESN